MIGVIVDEGERFFQTLYSVAFAISIHLQDNSRTPVEYAK